MIIGFTFNDKEQIHILEECLKGKGVLGLESEFFIERQRSLDMSRSSSEYLKEFNMITEFHSKFIKFLMMVKDSCISEPDLMEFKDMLREVIIDSVSDWDDYGCLSDQLEINFHMSITDRSYNGERLYYFIPSESYVIL